MASTGKKVGMFIAGSLLGLLLAAGGTYGLYEYAQSQNSGDTASSDASGSGGSDTAGDPSGDTAGDSDNTAETTAENTAGGDPDDGDVCTQASGCCEAYINAVSDMIPNLSVATTCAAVQNASQAGPHGHTACQQAMASWRTSLEQLSRDVPAICQPREGGGGGDAPAAEAPAGGGDGNICERAATCCQDYINAVSDMIPNLSVATTCAAVQNAQQAGPHGHMACEQAITSWRTSLTQMSRDVPASCQ